MHEMLERYLNEIGRYLAVKHDAGEILAEIRSHILEKAEHESGGVTEKSLRTVIETYGRPQDVAAKYMDGSAIILPTFRKHLFRYTAILFAVHFILTVIAVYAHSSFIAFPFFIIPRMPVWVALFYLPMAFTYDFGLVALTLYLVTQRKGNARLPWIGLPTGRRGAGGLERPKAAMLVSLLALLFLLLFLLVRYHTIFFYSVNLRAPESLLNPVSSMFFSIMFIAALALEIMGYWTRFLFNSAWVTLVQKSIVLLILWVVWNGPIRPVYRAVPGVDMGLIGGLFTMFFTVIAAVGFVTSLVRVAREISLP